jgi:dolichol-phosphate mannosyltransferase
MDGGNNFYRDARSHPTLVILCPVFNEADIIWPFCARLRPVMVELSDRYNVDLVFLNNASTDATVVRIELARQLWAQTYVLSMSRNVGYQNSLECGLRHAEGDVFVIIDVDCEDPPEMILQFVDRYEAGFDIVYGERIDRAEARPLKAARRAFYRILRRIADHDIILDMAEFALFTAEVRDAMMQENTAFPFIRAAIARVGFRRMAIPFCRQKRIGGASHYNIAGLSFFAIAGLLSASTLPLRLPAYLLPPWLLLLGALGAGFVLTGSPWMLLAASLAFAGYLGMTLSFTALYLARTYKNGLQRPNAFIDRRLSRPQMAHALPRTLPADPV